MNVRFDPFEALERAAHSESANPESEPAKAANSAKVPPTLATLATLAGGKLESERAEAKHASHLTAEWTPQDWLDHFTERAAIIEHDGEIPRPEAERHALDDTVNHWLVMHPPPANSEDDGCLHCGAALGDDGVPVLAGGTHT